MIEREIIGEAEEYHGRVLTARFMGPDLLGYVDGIELGGFYRNRTAAINAGKRYVDAEMKAKGETP